MDDDWRGMPWDNTARIQRDFFRTGMFTDLFISYQNNILDWTFTFRDLGMDHTIRRAFLVVPSGAGRWVVDSAELPSTGAMLEHVFGGHYHTAVQKMYEDFRIQCRLPMRFPDLPSAASIAPETPAPDTCADWDAAQSRSASAGPRE